MHRQSGVLTHLAPGLVVLALVLVFSANWRTTASLIQTWWMSPTYHHGLLVLPLFVYLIWFRRSDIKAVRVCPSVWGIAAAAVIALVWSLGYLMNVFTLQWLAWFAAVPALVLSVGGVSVLRALAFPLAYLLLALPVWDGLELLLQKQAVVAVAGVLRVLSIPVFSDGIFLRIPSGAFAVEEYCSGLRYMLAALAIGGVVAWTSYRTFRYRVAVLLVAFVAGIVLNWVRVLIIVLAGHLTDMQHSFVSDSHVHFGWVLFGGALFLLLWLSHRFEEPPMTIVETTSRSGAQGAKAPAGLLIGAAVTATVVMMTPALAGYTRGTAAPQLLRVQLAPVEAKGHWSLLSGPARGSELAFQGADATLASEYAMGRDIVTLSIAFYCTQAQGREVINETNILYSRRHWQSTPAGTILLDGQNGLPLEVAELHLKTGGDSDVQQVLWVSYWVGGKFTASRYAGKLLQIKGLLSGRERAAAIVLKTRVQDSVDKARARLTDYWGNMGAAIAQELRRAACHQGA